MLLGMTREELKTVCPEEGGRVFYQLQAVKSTMAVSDRSQCSFTVRLEIYYYHTHRCCCKHRPSSSCFVFQHRRLPIKWEQQYSERTSKMKSSRSKTVHEWSDTVSFELILSNEKIKIRFTVCLPQQIYIIL